MSLSLVTSWVSANWKWLSVSAGLILAGGKTTYSYVDDVNTRIEALEMEIPAQLDRIEQTGLDTRCMIINHHLGLDPLECVKE